MSFGLIINDFAVKSWKSIRRVTVVSRVLYFFMSRTWADEKNKKLPRTDYYTVSRPRHYLDLYAAELTPGVRCRCRMRRFVEEWIFEYLKIEYFENLFSVYFNVGMFCVWWREGRRIVIIRVEKLSRKKSAEKKSLPDLFISIVCQNKTFPLTYHWFFYLLSTFCMQFH